MANLVYGASETLYAFLWAENELKSLCVHLQLDT